jgi:hypothetical protein
MFTVSLIQSSKRVQNEISAKVMPKPQDFTAGAALRGPRAFREKIVARLRQPTQIKRSYGRNTARAFDCAREETYALREVVGSLRGAIAEAQ